VLNEALLAAERSEERWFECEMYILKASLFARVRGALPGRDPRVIARTDLHHAYHAATKMESPSLRLRAANALSPLLREQGHLREARDLICDAYETFKEGFQTADLADAQAMLGE